MRILRLHDSRTLLSYNLASAVFRNSKARHDVPSATYLYDVTESLKYMIYKNRVFFSLFKTIRVQQDKADADRLSF